MKREGKIMSPQEVLVEAIRKGYKVTDSGKVIGIKGKELKLMNNGKGYLFFHMRVKGRKRAVPVHRLVAYTKYGDELFKHEMVRHLDNDKQNNSTDNIALGNWLDNYNDMSEEIRNKMLASQIRSRKFTDSEIIEIRKSLEEGRTVRGMAEKFNVSPGTIQQIKERRTYKWVS